jgi:hypothetical protein
MASYDDLVAEALVFLKCEAVVSDEFPNAGTLADIPSAGSADPGIITGVYNNGYDFPTINAYGQLAVATFSTTSDFSIGGWFQTAEELQQAAIGVRHGTGWGNYIGLNPFSRWGGGSGGRGTAVFYEGADEESGVIQYSVSNGHHDDDSAFYWYCMERSGTDLNLYVDDETTIVDSVVVSDLSGTPTHVEIASQEGGNMIYAFDMDDVFIFDRVLTTVEKTALKDATNPVASGVPGAYFRLINN